MSFKNSFCAIRNPFFALLLTLTTCIPKETSKIEVLTLKSELFGNERALRVYLPPQYDGKKAFKVLYLNDGQNIFDSDKLNKKDDWRVDEITDSLVMNGEIEPLIIVGIDNAGVSSRGNEYLPWQDVYLSPPIPNLQGKKYPNFLTKEVIPLIKSKYVIKEGKENTGIGGFSYGGLISIYTAMMSPENFGFLIAETPSLYVNDKKLLQEAQNHEKGWPDRVYIGVGTNELALKNCMEEHKDNKMAVDDIKNLLSIIERKSPNTKIEFNVVKCAVHTYREASYRLPKALKFVLDKER